MGLLNDEVLGQQLGDDSFPVEWASEDEKRLFWVYDDLHCPKPLSPMYEDIGGWWLSCDHMFRRFGTPFATDWIYKNINGYLYTAAIPAEAGLKFDTQEYNYRTNPIVPEGGDEDYAEKIGAYLGATLGVYGQNFAGWWKTRFVPEMQRNFDYIEGMLEQKDELSLADLAVLLEDAIDMHDRHWKIHWMLNFAQLSATLNLRAVMEETHGQADEVLLGRLQNSANDRNWDKIRALWEMKEEVKADAELRQIFSAETATEIRPALESSASRPALHRGAHRALSAGVRLARGLEPRVRVPHLPRGHDPHHPARPRPVLVRLRLPRTPSPSSGRISTRPQSRSSTVSRARRSRRCAPPTRSTSRWHR